MRYAPSFVAGVFIGAVTYWSVSLAGEHKIVDPGELEWQAGPSSLPPGAKSAVLYGDPSKEGLFALRLMLPKGYQIPPHTHPKPEIVTVISGEGRLGMGEKADEENVTRLRSGSFMAMPPGTAHYVYVDAETVVQLNSTGPWEIKYVNPKDDPRQKTN